MNIKLQVSVRYRRIQSTVFRRIIKWRKSKVLVITGCGRSGTTFSSKFLKEAGLSIGHERLNLHGISSWYLVSNEGRVPFGPSYRDIKSLDLVVVHQVREPLAAISSMLSIGRLSWTFLCKEIPIADSDSKILKAMKYYYYWNLKAEERAHYRVRAENFQNEICPILTSNGFKISRSVNVSSTDRINTRKHGQLTWEDLRREDEVLCNNIMAVAERYGYKPHLS